MENDWRITDQEDYLMKVKLKKHSYKRYSETWDHEHCCFCWEKFSENEKDGLTCGYSTLDEENWICEECFNDFKDMFEWEVTT